MKLPKHLRERYKILRPDIKKRLIEFAQVPESEYFYELCFCLCTPQSKAKNAFQVVEKLKDLDFMNNPFNPVEILSDRNYYIRFHNQKAKRLMMAKDYYPEVLKILNDKTPAFEKREKITEIVNGFGLKETSHFLRNIGYRGLAILDRHILKHLKLCGVFDEIPKISSKKQYYEIERTFIKFADKVNIDPDELDILFWSYETGEILK